MRPDDPSDVTDESLAASAREGDVRAFETLLGRHETRVLRLLRLLGIPADDREDVAQEVFVRVFRHLRGFRPGFAFGAWIYRITVNAAHDHRKRRRTRVARESALAEGWEETADPREHGGRADEGLDSRRRLERALERLTDRERAVFVLTELDGMEVAGVARVLGITRITVRRHLSRARARLQRHLGGPTKKNRGALNDGDPEAVVSE